MKYFVASEDDFFIQPDSGGKGCLRAYFGRRKSGTEQLNEGARMSNRGKSSAKDLKVGIP